MFSTWHNVSEPSCLFQRKHSDQQCDKSMMPGFFFPSWACFRHSVVLVWVSQSVYLFPLSMTCFQVVVTRVQEASDGIQPGKEGVSLRPPLTCTLQKLLKFLLELSDLRVFQEGGEQIHYGCNFNFTPG